jgi:autotransporter translocation and assembly factor TamB
MKKRYKIPLIFLCIVLSLILVVYLLITQTRFLETEVARYLSTLADRTTPVKIKIGKIRSFLWGEVIVENLQVEYAEKGYEYTLLDLKRLELDFSLADLLRRKWDFKGVRLYQPKIQIKQAQDGRLLIPFLKKGKGTSTGVPNFSFPFVLFKDGKIDWFSVKKNLELDSMNFTLSLSNDKEGINLNLIDGKLLARIEKTLELKRIRGKAKIKSSRLTLENVKLETADSKLELLSGTLDLKPLSFSINLKGDPFYLADIKRISGIGLDGKLNFEGNLVGNLKRIKGNLVLNGDMFKEELSGLKINFLFEKKKFTFYSIQGKAFRSPVLLKGELNLGEKPESYTLEGKVKNLDLANIVATSLHSDLSGNLNMQGKGLEEKSFLLNFNLELEPGKFDRYTFSKAAGNLTVSLNEVQFGKDFQLWYKNTEITGEGRVGFNDSLNLQGKAIFRDLSNFNGQTFVQEMGGRGEFQFKARGPVTDFSLEGRFESDSIWGYKLFSSDLKSDVKIDKFISRKGGIIRSLLLNGTAWSVPYDSLTSAIFLEGDSIRIDTTRMMNNFLSLVFFGNLDISKFPQNLTLEQINLDYRGNKIESQIPAKIELDKEEVRFTQDSFTVNGGSFNVSGKMDYEERMDLKVDLNNISVLAWERFLLPERRIEGKADASLQIRGDFKNPELALDIQITDCDYEGVVLGNLTGNLSYKDKLLKMESLSLVSPDGSYSLAGTLPLDLSFYPVPERVLNQPQNMIFKGEGNRFSLVHLFIPDVEYLQGLFKGEVNLTGTPLHPELRGNLELSQGILKLVPLQNPITEMIARIRMENENLFFDEVRGFASQEETTENLLKKIWHSVFPKEKVKGEIFLYGNINLGDIKEPKYDLTLVGRNLPLSYEYADLTATTDFNLEVAGALPPTVSGNIYFTQLAFKDPFTSLMQTKAGPSIPNENLWDLRLNLSGDNNLWVLNQDMQAEFKGEVILSQKSGELRLLGSMETIRGKDFIFGTTFNIEKGNFAFDNIEKIDPKLDFLVTTSLTGSVLTATDSITRAEQEVELAITGTLSAPEIEPAPGSPYSKEQIAELLAFHQNVSGAGGGSLFQSRLVGSLGEAYANRFLGNLAARSIGVETFEIKPLEPGRFSLLESEVTVGKYISNKVYLRYTRRLSQSTGQEAGVEYRLGKRFYFEGYRDKLGLFHMGLNLYWEY